MGFVMRRKGKQVRDAIHIKDLVNLILFNSMTPELFNKGVFNVGGGKESSFSLFELTNLCRQVTGRTVDVSCDMYERYADIPVYISDCSKINGVCGWKNELNIEDIIQDAYNWFTDKESSLVCFRELSAHIESFFRT